MDSSFMNKKMIKRGFKNNLVDYKSFQAIIDNIGRFLFIAWFFIM